MTVQVANAGLGVPPRPEALAHDALDPEAQCPGLAQGQASHRAAQRPAPLARLLADGPATSLLGAQRLGLGAAGLALLQAAHTTQLGELSLGQRLAAPGGLVLAAAAALVLALPGTLILLTALGTAPSWTHAWTALGRAYFTVGLLAAGLAPLVALFAWTGAELGATTALAFGAYALAGTVGLTGLPRQLSRSLQQPHAGALLVLSGFWCFSLFVGVYTWFRLMEGVLS